VIRTNLSTRPFYNEAAVRAVLALVGVAAVAATVFNVARVVQLSRRNTQYLMQARNDETRGGELRAAAARFRASVDLKAIDRARDEARQANELIDRRTFSWTELFNRFETTLPDEVRITTVRPSLDPQRGILLTVLVVARDVDDVNEFIENLEGTGAFTDLLAQENRVDEQEQLVATLEMIYRAAAGQPPAEGAGR
jgi:Tfp pilus assembly protein PilN